MDFSSWIRKALLKKNKSDPSNPSSSQTEPNLKQRKIKEIEEEEEEELGVTDELKDFVKSLTVETFKNFPLQQVDADDNQVKTLDGSDNVQKDLSEWQERHAMLVLTIVKEISLLRYVLCPRHLKDRQFWQIYFMLVKNYVSPFELRSIRKAKLRRMAMDDGKLVESPAYEVEMAEAKLSARPLPSESDAIVDSV